MKKYFISIVLMSAFFTAMHGTVGDTPPKQAAIQKINDDLYTATLADDFYVALERVNRDNIDAWMGYAALQVTAAGRMNLKYLPNVDGAAHFKSVLEYYKNGKMGQMDELWIAYASRAPIRGKAVLNIGRDATNADIEMYMTVITSPDALISTHMGISRTWEAASDLQQDPPKRARHSYQSLHLHSFAAGVIKMRDPKKIYMVTAPAGAMRDIIIKKMPANTVFIGDNLYEKALIEAEADPKTLLDADDLKKSPERVKKLASDMYQYLRIKEKNELLKTNPPRMRKEIQEGEKRITLLKSDGSLLVTFDQSNPAYQWFFLPPYLDKGLHLPYVLVDLASLARFM